MRNSKNKIMIALHEGQISEQQQQQQPLLLETMTADVILLCCVSVHSSPERLRGGKKKKKRTESRASVTQTATDPAEGGVDPDERWLEFTDG